MVVRAPNGAIVAASQRPRTVLRPGRRPIRLTQSPRGTGAEGTALPAQALRRALHGAGGGRASPSGQACASARATGSRADRDRRPRGRVTRAPHGRAVGRGAVPELGARRRSTSILKTGELVKLTGDPPACRRSTSPTVRLLLHRRQRGRVRGGSARPSRRRAGAACCARRARAPTRGPGRAWRCGSRRRRAGSSSRSTSRSRRRATAEDAAAIALRLGA